LNINLSEKPFIGKSSSQYHPGNLGSSYTVFKRSFDLVTALLLFVLGWPLFLLIGILIKIDSPGPVIFKQVRIGKGCMSFYILKFRTMVQGGDELLAEHLNSNPSLKLDYSQYQKLKNDPRLTWTGQILRRLSLDELPQLWNVIKGEMSLVGPRPFLPEQTRMYGNAAEFYKQALPGITGLWQVSGRNHLSFRERAVLDVVYLQNRSLGMDLRILWRTIWVLIEGRGAY